MLIPLRSLLMFASVPVKVIVASAVPSPLPGSKVRPVTAFNVSVPCVAVRVNLS